MDHFADPSRPKSRGGSLPPRILLQQERCLLLRFPLRPCCNKSGISCCVTLHSTELVMVRRLGRVPAATTAMSPAVFSPAHPAAARKMTPAAFSSAPLLHQERCLLLHSIAFSRTWLRHVAWAAPLLQQQRCLLLRFPPRILLQQERCLRRASRPRRVCGGGAAAPLFPPPTSPPPRRGHVGRAARGACVAAQRALQGRVVHAVQGALQRSARRNATPDAIIQHVQRRNTILPSTA